MRHRIFACLAAAVLLCSLTAPAAFAAGDPTLSYTLQGGQATLTLNNLDAPVYAVQLEIPLTAAGKLEFQPSQDLNSGSTASPPYCKLDVKTEGGNRVAVLYLDSLTPINANASAKLGTLASDGALALGKNAKLIVVKGQLEGAHYDSIALSSSGGSQDDSSQDGGSQGGSSDGSHGSSSGSSHGDRTEPSSTAKGEALSVSADQRGLVAIKRGTLKAASSLEIKGDATLRFDEGALQSLKNAGADIQIHVAVLPTAEASRAIQVQLGSAARYEIALTAGEKPLTTLNGAIQISIPFSGKGRPVAYRVAEGGASRIGAASLNGSAAVFSIPLQSDSQVAVLDITHQFSDVDGWYDGFVNTVAAAGIMTGVTPTSFQPNQIMTRAELVTTLARLSGDTLEGSPSGFTDVPADAWFAPYVAWAKQSGVTSGVSESAFQPQGSITREQMATMFARFAAVKGIDLSKTVAPASFTDSSKISTFAQDAVSLMQQAGILNGKDGGQFDPQGTATRAECAKMLAIIQKAMG